jgi:hypothetical protein
MKNSYHLKEDGFEARWFEGTSHEECNASRKDCFEQEFRFLEEWR